MADRSYTQEESYSEESSPGYIEITTSSRKKTKENLNLDQLMPSAIFESAANLQNLLKSYYDYMNLKEFTYVNTVQFTDRVLDGRAVFRILDPENLHNEFFTDDDGANSSLVITNNDGISTTIALDDSNVEITNGNNLPGSLADSTSQIGKTFNVRALDDFNTQIATLVTPIRYWAGAGASYAINTTEEALDIDQAEEHYLELIQKEIAPFIPKSLSVDKRTLYKNIVEYYKVRGSTESIEIFFRLLFNESVEIEYPYNKTLIPSSGNWDNDSNIYKDKKGFLSDSIKLHDSYFYQKFSYLIKTGRNITEWTNIYKRLVHPAGFIFFGEILLFIELTRDILGDNVKGVTDTILGDDGLPRNINVYPRTDRKTWSSLPGKQPGVIGIEDLPFLVEMFAGSWLPTTYAKIHRNARLSVKIRGGEIKSVEIPEPGYGYRIAPNITMLGNGSGSTATCTIDSEGKISTVTVTPGSGYTTAVANIDDNINIGQVANIFIGADDTRTYSAEPKIILSGPTKLDIEGNLHPDNVNALGSYVLQETSVKRVRIINTGKGYLSNPIATFSDPEVPGTTATGYTRINKETGELRSIYINNPGSGYTSQPTVTISGGGGTGASADVLLEEAEIVGVNIDESGVGYIIDPTVTLVSGPMNELRAKDTIMYDIILLNLFSMKENNYYSMRKYNIHDTAEMFNNNQAIGMFGDVPIESDEIIFNSYNDATTIDITTI